MNTASPGRKQLTHERILDTAAAALRRGGFAGIGVADIMQRAGLTHGGIYAHFPSRDVLPAEALERAGQDSGRRLRLDLEAGARKGLSPFRALVESYLSPLQLKSPESGCPVAALASEAPRQAEAVQQAAAARVAGLGDSAAGRRHLASARRFLLEQFDSARPASR